MRATHRPLTVAALLLSMFMAAMEATVVGTAMPSVVGALHAAAQIGWIGSAYLLAATVSVPLYGKLADLYGRKPIVMLGIVLFLVGSTASGAATSITWLIAARAVQGLGAGAMQPISLTIVGDIFTLEERGRIQGVFGSVWGIAAVAGPLLGGLLVHALSWRWVFWINLPFGLASMALLSVAYKEQRRAPKDVSVDWLGASLLTCASLALLFGAEREAPWLTFPLAAVLLVAFVLVERRAKAPVLPMSLVMRRSIGVAAIASSLLGAAMTGSVLYAPLFVQTALGRSPTVAGATVAPMLLGWPIASALTTRFLLRTGFRTPVIAGSVVCALALAAFAELVARGYAPPVLGAIMFVYGLGMGLANTALLLAVQTGVEYEERGVATATAMFSRSMGGALGAGALGALLAARLASTLPASVVDAILDPARRATQHLDAHVGAALRDGLAPVFWVVAAIGVLNLLAVAFFPRDKPLAQPAPVEEPALGE